MKMNNPSTAIAKLIAYKRDVIKSLLSRCNKDQQMIFKRMYSHTNLELPINDVVDSMPPDKLEWAIGQCDRTVENNKSLIS